VTVGNMEDNNIKDNVRRFTARHSITNVCLLSNGLLLLSKPGSKMQFKDIRKSLAKYDICHSGHMFNTPFPNAFLNGIINYDSDIDEKVLLNKGAMFTTERLKQIVKEKKNKYLNENIVTKSTTQLLEDGLINVFQIDSVTNAKEKMERIVLEEQNYTRLTAPYSMTFIRGVFAEGVFWPEPMCMPVNVYIVPYEIGVKKRHIFIKSEQPGWSKTYNMTKFAEEYDVAWVPDPTNWCGVRDNSQFLCMDEYGRSNKMPFVSFKALTSGNPRAYGGNRKTHGANFSNSDKSLQLLINSNESIYDIYGKWDSKLQRFFISKQDRDAIDERFNVYVLDGDAHMERIKYTHPRDQTKEELLTCLVYDIRKSMFDIAKEVTVRYDLLVIEFTRQVVRTLKASGTLNTSKSNVYSVIDVLREHVLPEQFTDRMKHLVDKVYNPITVDLVVRKINQSATYEYMPLINKVNLYNYVYAREFSFPIKMMCKENPKPKKRRRFEFLLETLDD